MRPLNITVYSQDEGDAIKLIWKVYPNVIYIGLLFSDPILTTGPWHFRVYLPLR